MRPRALFLWIGLATCVAGLAGCAKTKGRIKVTVDNQRIRFSDRVRFEYNSDTIKPASFPLLDAIAEVIKDRPEIVRVRIAGYTDNVGGKKFNLSLSRRRAEAIRVYLIKAGISPKRLTAVGYGEKHPIASNRTARGRRKNRRVEFIVSRRSD